jgi:polyisoprenoid-binding protein YceI
VRSGCVLFLLAFASVSFGQTARPIDAANSTVTVSAYKTGLFSFAGHDHTVSAPIASGTLDEGKRTIEFTIQTKELKVLDPGESDKNRVEIRTTMLSDKLLDAEKYPAITFRSTDVRQLTPATFDVRGDLTLHGISRPIAMNVTKNGGRYTGVTKLKQTDFGMEPVSVAGGTVKVKDEVKIEVSLSAK